MPFVATASLVKRRTIATELGQAFCRLMLQDHFDIIYFAHMSEVLKRPAHAAFQGMAIRRIAAGDVPDYLCAPRTGELVLGEAKGRFGAVSFVSRPFQLWREQFERVIALNRGGQARQLKGYIVATRLATEARPLPTRVFIEDTQHKR